MLSRRWTPGRTLLLILVLGSAGLIAAVVFLGEGGSAPVRSSLAVAEALSADTAGFARAVKPRELAFPDDHGPHPAFRTEWWYYTGNLEASNGPHFGYQITIFRTALRPESDVDSVRRERNDSLWSTRQIYMAHISLSDAESGRFYSSERFSRGAAGLAGAETSPYRVWLEDWSIRGPSADSVRILAETDEASLDLTLIRTKPIVLQGNQGLDAKGPEPGNASYYYSMTRMETRGTITVAGRTYSVEGLSWMDHEWSTSALGEDMVGWDWFALQLDDGREIMYYRLREDGDGTSPYSGGVIVNERGDTVRLSEDDVLVEPTDYWKSPETGNRYPVEWLFRIPSREIDLRIEPYLPNQELAQTVTYWEGAVRVEGSAEGVGFVELTGYGESDNSFATR